MMKEKRPFITDVTQQVRADVPFDTLRERAAAFPERVEGNISRRTSQPYLEGELTATPRHISSSDGLLSHYRCEH